MTHDPRLVLKNYSTIELELSIAAARARLVENEEEEWHRVPSRLRDD